MHQTGKPYVGRSQRVMLDARRRRRAREEAFFDFVYQPIPGPDGRTDSILVVAFEVTSLVKAKQEAEAARARAEASEHGLKTFIDNLPELAWTALPDGHIDYYNRRWYEYTGTTFEEMQGWGWEKVHDPELLPKVVERWKHSLATGEPFEMEFTLRGADGIARWFLTRVAPSRDASGKIIRWFGTNTNIDEIKASLALDRGDGGAEPRNRSGAARNARGEGARRAARRRARSRRRREAPTVMTVGNATVAERAARVRARQDGEGARRGSCASAHGAAPRRARHRAADAAEISSGSPRRCRGSAASRARSERCSESQRSSRRYAGAREAQRLERGDTFQFGRRPFDLAPRECRPLHRRPRARLEPSLLLDWNAMGALTMKRSPSRGRSTGDATAGQGRTLPHPRFPRTTNTWRLSAA